MDDTYDSYENACTSSRSRELLDRAPIGLECLGSDGKILWANHTQLQLLGYGREDYIGSHIHRFQADAAVCRSFLDRVLAGETLRDYPAPLRRADGELRHVLLDAKATQAPGSAVHIGCFVRDITDAKRLEDADRLKDEFLATVSHELRTPLNAILGWARLLRGGQVAPQKRDGALATIQRNAEAQARLIDELLDLARIMNGKLGLEMRALDLAGVVDAAVDTVRPLAEGKGLRMTAAIAPEVGPFVGDRSRLGQVMTNLIHNAVKFTPSGGEVHVSLSRTDDHAHIVVCDTGIGIAADLIDHVFERFRQGAFALRQTDGLGLGLAIVRHLVELHGGRVEAHSAGFGLGATFSVLLPLLPAGEAEPAEPPVTTQSLAGLRVLLVDDDADNRDLVGEVLTLAGASVVTAEGAREAFAALRRSPPDVLLTDIGLTAEDGYSFLERVRDAGFRMPAAALTGHARAKDRARSRAAGYDEHITKPIDPAALVEVVAALAARDH